MSVLETLVALPVLLLVAGAAVQWMWVLHAQQALGYAAVEAARAGSLAHADPAAIEAGLARGLLPWLGGTPGAAAFEADLTRALGHLQHARLNGWLRVIQLSPAPSSFDDWAQAGRDSNGALLPDVREIPNDDLAHRRFSQWPASGTAGSREGAPIGQVSGQTLADANLLRLRIAYSVPLSVPVVGRVVAVTLRAWHGCDPPSVLRLGLLSLGRAWLGPPSRDDLCPLLGGVAGARTGGPRMPVWAVATVRMHTPARIAGMEPDRPGWGAEGRRSTPDRSDPESSQRPAESDQPGPLPPSLPRTGDPAEGAVRSPRAPDPVDGVPPPDSEEGGFCRQGDS